MKTYIQKERENILRDEISSRRLQAWLPLLCGIAAALPALAFTIKSLSLKMLAFEFIVVVLGVGIFLWNIHYKRKHREDAEKIEKLLEKIAQDE